LKNNIDNECEPKVSFIRYQCTNGYKFISNEGLFLKRNSVINFYVIQYFNYLIDTIVSLCRQNGKWEKLPICVRSNLKNLSFF
jgi:hypothetical protein